MHGTGSEAAQPHTLRQAKVLAYIAIDVYMRPHLVQQMKLQLQQDLKKEEEAAHKIHTT